MSRYDVYALESGSGLVLDVQSNLLEPLNTRVVVPLMPLASAPKPARRLDPVFDLDGQSLVMVTQFTACCCMRGVG